MLDELHTLSVIVYCLNTNVRNGNETVCQTKSCDRCGFCQHVNGRSHCVTGVEIHKLFNFAH